MSVNGTVGILNVGAGDTKLVFDKSNPADCIRAARIVKDMLRRGYALLVEVERNGAKAFERARDFDETKCEYVIADFDPVTAEKADAAEGQHEEAQQEGDASASGGTDETIAKAEKPQHGKRRGGPKLKGVSASSTRAVAVSRSAGG